MTEETVTTEQLGAYLDILNETVTFDMDSKRPLSKEELNRIDWAGTSAGQQRERWFYMDVYEISGTNPADAVAVKVNNQYHIARVSLPLPFVLYSMRDSLHTVIRCFHAVLQ